jgi:hypothetical protein
MALVRKRELEVVGWFVDSEEKLNRDAGVALGENSPLAQYMWVRSFMHTGLFTNSLPRRCGILSVKKVDLITSQHLQRHTNVAAVAGTVF